VGGEFDILAIALKVSGIRENRHDTLEDDGDRTRALADLTPGAVCLAFEFPPPRRPSCVCFSIGAAVASVGAENLAQQFELIQGAL